MAVLIFFPGPTSHAQSVENTAILYVDADSGGPMNDGTSWCSAFTTLQHALGVAVSGDIILVAEGTYMPDGGYKPIGGAHVAGSGDRTATFQLKTGVKLIGGYAGCGQLDPGERDIAAHPTILSGDLNANDGPFFQNNTENSLHVVTGSGVARSALIDGFTIRDGLPNAPDLPNGLNGGGVLCDGGSPTIANCLITHNTAGGGGGGGMRFYGGSDALITKCTIDTNLATGIFCLLSSPVFTDCTITWNYGSGISAYACNLTAVNCEISHNNYSGGFGGGVRFGSEGRSMLSGCKISGNSAETGGGIYARSLTDVAVSSCVITGNSASNWGGGVASYEAISRLPAA